MFDLSDITVGVLIQALTTLMKSPTIDIDTVSQLLHILMRRLAPTTLKSITNQTGDEVIDRALVLIREFHGRPCLVSHIAQRLHISPSQLHRRCQRVLGQGVKQIIDDQRLLFAARLLCLGERSPTAVVAAMNFSDTAELSRFIRQRTGMSPRALRQQYIANHISSATATNLVKNEH